MLDRGTAFEILQLDADAVLALTLDRALGDKWLVTAGLAAGDRVIVEGLQKVRPGMAVKALPFGAPPAGPPGDDANPPAAAPKQ